MSKSKTYTIGSLFSGVGGIDLGFKNQGFDILWSNDNDKYCSIVFDLNFDHKFFHQDIRSLSGKDLKPVDVLTAGFPCQPFSIAGYRKGIDDERGNLFFEIIRIINELDQKPKVLFFENVKNFSTHDDGRTLKIIRKKLEDLDYFVHDSVLNTSEYTNIPQNRERTFLICFLEGKNADFDLNKNMTSKFRYLYPPKKNKSFLSMDEILEKNVDDSYFYKEDKYMYQSLVENMKSKETFYQWRRQYVRENKNNLCPTLTANMGTGGHNVPLVLTDEGIRKLTPRECFNLQGFPKTFKLHDNFSKAQLYKQSGNSVTVKLVEILAAMIKDCLS